MRKGWAAALALATAGIQRRVRFLQYVIENKKNNYMIAMREEAIETEI